MPQSRYVAYGLALALVWGPSLSAVSRAQGQAVGVKQALPLPGASLPTRTAEPEPGSIVQVDPGRTFRYRLGPGDRLRMSVFKVDGYAADVEVLSDGSISLPRLNSVSVAGLTLDEAQRRITHLYSRYLRRPLVYLDLLAPRPVRVTIVGEVQKPGYYSISQDSRQSTLGTVGAAQTTVVSSGWPTLVDAIQRAGGITGMADLSHVSLSRTSGGPSTQRVFYRFDFLSSLMGGVASPNPLIMDGDTIDVARSDRVIPSDVLIKAGKSNFSADAIAVTVVGEVNAPGLKQVRSNSSLTDAVMAAGDINQLRADANFIRLLRLQSDGNVISLRLRLEPSAPLGSRNNPVLQNGDVIVVARNGWTSLNQRLTQAVEPIGPLLNAASLYNILTNGP